MLIATAGDDRYAIGIAALAASALLGLHPKDQVRLVILDAGLSDGTALALSDGLRRLHGDVVVDVIDIRTVLPRGIPVDPRFGVATWAPFIVPEIAGSAERVICIDADALVHHDLADLWKLDLEGYAFAACRDYRAANVEAGLPDMYEHLGLDGDSPYYNAGVLLIDVAEWKRQRLLEKALSYLRTYAGTVRFADQDALNAVGGRSCLALDPRWNVQVLPLDQIDELPDDPFRDALRHMKATLREEARIVHFVGFKPWQPEGLRLSSWSLRLHGQFLYYLRRSGLMTGREYAAWCAKWYWAQVPRAFRAAHRRRARLNSR
jgi:lipopolysaccharide biosynthesis glycosyltransferase